MEEAEASYGIHRCHGCDEETTGDGTWAECENCNRLLCTYCNPNGCRIRREEGYEHCTEGHGCSCRTGEESDGEDDDSSSETDIDGEEDEVPDKVFVVSQCQQRDGR